MSCSKHADGPTQPADACCCVVLCCVTLCCAVLWFCAGPGYRNVVGLPGGVKSPYFKLLQEANVNGMELREGQGNVYQVRTHATA